MGRVDLLPMLSVSLCEGHLIVVLVMMMRVVIVLCHDCGD